MKQERTYLYSIHQSYRMEIQCCHMPALSAKERFGFHSFRVALDRMINRKVNNLKFSVQLYNKQQKKNLVSNFVGIHQVVYFRRHWHHPEVWCTP